MYNWNVYWVGDENIQDLRQLLNDCEDREEEVFQILAVARDVCIITRNSISEVTL